MKAAGLPLLLFDKMIENGVNIEYKFKRVKNLRITIKRDNSVVVSIPLFMKRKQAEDFVSKKMLWIKKHISALEKQKYALNKDILYLWGEPYKKEIIISNKNQCVIEKDAIKIFIKDENKLNSVLNKYLRKELLEKAAIFLESWQQKTGIIASEMRIKDMKTRWGSCNIEKKRIWLSLRLVNYDMECLSYVILHEILHIKQRYHNKSFYNMLSYFLPQWKEYRKLLN
ncbi:MAG: M48 family metallopeptidase [Bacillota bacterium]